MKENLKKQAVANLEETRYFDVVDLYPDATKCYYQNVTVPAQDFEDADEVAAHPNKYRFVLVMGDKQKTLWGVARNNDPVTHEERIALEDMTLVWGQNPDTKEWAKAPKVIY